MTKLTKKEQRDRVDALIEEFNLHHVRKNNGDSLSGGERRNKILIAVLHNRNVMIKNTLPFSKVQMELLYRPTFAGRCLFPCQ